MKVLFLGTSSMVPTKKRNQSGLLIKHNKEHILLDCGEGIQRQFVLAGASVSKITRILISHWHGDHVLGLPGLVQTMNGSDYDRTLQIYGPKGTKKFMKKMFEAFEFDQRIKIQINEVSSGLVFETKELKVRAQKMNHCVDCLAYRIEEKDKRRILMSKVKKLGISAGPVLGKLQQGKSVVIKGNKIKPEDVSSVVAGKKVVVISDTSECKDAVLIARDADMLVCESTFDMKHKDKARKYMHLTASDAAVIAKDAKVKRLYLTHFSTRFKDVKVLVAEAKKIFKNVKAAEDFLEVVV